MCKSTAEKILVTFLFIAALNSGCTNLQNFFKKPESQPAILKTVSNTEIPFSNAEPEIYQTEIHVTTSDGDESAGSKTFVARNGPKRLITFSSGEDSAISRLQLRANENYLISDKEKLFAKAADADVSFPVADSLEDFLTNEWLSQKSPANFEKLETKNGVTRFRVRLNNAENDLSYSIIYFDDKLGMTIKQEFFTDANSPPVYVMKLQNVKLEAAAMLFEIPSGFREVSREEFEKLTQSAEQK